MNSSSSIIILSFIYTLLLFKINTISFSLDIEYYQKICFQDYIMANTPFHVKIQSQKGSNTFEMSITLNNTKIIQKKTKDNSKQTGVRKFDSYAVASNTYQFCIQNFGKDQTFNINFYQGVQLSDITAFPQEQDKKMINKLVDQLNSIYQNVRQQEHFSIKLNEYNMQLQKMVSFKSVGFGFLSITVVLIISFLHYLEIKRVLRKRKII